LPRHFDQRRARIISVRPELPVQPFAATDLAALGARVGQGGRHSFEGGGTDATVAGPLPTPEEALRQLHASLNLEAGAG
jgi:hypothetical protein